MTTSAVVPLNWLATSRHSSTNSVCSPSFVPNRNLLLIGPKRSKGCSPRCSRFPSKIAISSPMHWALLANFVCTRPPQLPRQHLASVKSQLSLPKNSTAFAHAPRCGAMSFVWHRCHAFVAFPHALLPSSVSTTGPSLRAVAMATTSFLMRPALLSGISTLKNALVF